MVWRLGLEIMTRINLLPRQRWIWTKFFLLMAGIILLSWHMVLRQKINAAAKHNKHLQQELNTLITQVRNHVDLKKQQRVGQQSASYIASLEQKRTNLVQIFEILNQGVSGSVYFTQLLIKNGEVRIIGQTKSMFDLKQLITKLAAAKYGESAPSIQKITKQNDGYGFVLLWLYKRG